MANRKPESDLKLERVNELFEYNSDTGVFVQKVRRGRKLAGSLAGYINADGYRMIWVDGRWYLGHRLAWFVTSGRWPSDEIDHINGDRSDNRIANLREASRRLNMQNVKQGGWHYHSAYKKWQALIRVDGKRLYLGRFDNEEQARHAYESARAIHHPFSRSESIL